MRFSLEELLGYKCQKQRSTIYPGEPTTGKTGPETILRQLNAKKGQVYSMLQAKTDVDTLLAMGIMEDVSIVPQPAGDSGKVDLTINAVERVTINAVERVSGGITAGGGIVESQVAL